MRYVPGDHSAQRVDTVVVATKHTPRAAEVETNAPPSSVFAAAGFEVRRRAHAEGETFARNRRFVVARRREP